MRSSVAARLVHSRALHRRPVHRMAARGVRRLFRCVADNKPRPGDVIGDPLMTGAAPPADARCSLPSARLSLLAAAFALLLTTSPALARADGVAGEGESDKASAPPKTCPPPQAGDKTDENGKDKKKNGDDKDKEKKEEMEKVLRLVAEGKMTVGQALEKLAEKADDEKDKDKDKEEGKCKLLPEGWNFHAQTTIIPEFDAGFQAKYSGPNSLSPQAQREGTVTADLFLGAPLWHGAEFHADLLLWQGFGLSNTFGLNADPNADAFKAGTQAPRFMFSHFIVRQTIGLGGGQVDVPDGPLTLPGKQDVSRLTVTLGRMWVGDIFDQNTYDHDPHTQFMNWAGTMLSWDFPADTCGFTTGIAIELNQPDWTLRYGWFQMPRVPNGFTSDDRIFMWPVLEPDDGPTSDGEFWKEWGMILELERRWRICDRPGAVRLSAYLEHGDWARYDVATPLLIANPPPPNTPQGVEITIPAAAFDFHYKYGFGLNWEQEIADNVGVFGRVGWNDGQTAAATYTDVNWTAQLGMSVKGAAWRRPGDTFGICGNLDGASNAQVAFLKVGGTGISDGDGTLSYSPEMTFETYYDIAIAKYVHLAVDYQFFANPSFNRDRGPVNVFLGRLHWEY